jgi:hypothetical protein
MKAKMSIFEIRKSASSLKHHQGVRVLAGLLVILTLCLPGLSHALSSSPCPSCGSDSQQGGDACKPPTPPPPSVSCSTKNYPGTICRTENNNPYAPVCTSVNEVGGCCNWKCFPRPDRKGCFAEGTLITLAGGTVKTVEELKVGDVVWNPVTKTALTIQRIVEGPEHNPLVVIKTATSEVTITALHPVLTTDGLKQAEALSAADVLIDGSGAAAPILSIGSKNPGHSERVINFFLGSEDSGTASEHLVVSDGIVTGDLYLQNNFESLTAE